MERSVIKDTELISMVMGQ